MDPKSAISRALPAETRSRRLTTTHLSSLRARDKPYDIYDAAIPGLILHVPPSGAKVWKLRFLWRGRRTKLTLGDFPALSQAYARDQARDARKLLEQGIDPRRAGLRRTRVVAPIEQGKPESGSVHWLADEFMERFIRPHRKHPDHVQRILNVELLPYLGARDARTIKPRDIIELLDRIVERGSPIMANRVAGILAQLFKFAVHRAVLDTSPVQLLYRPGGPERPRERVLSDEELGALLSGNEEIFKRAPRTASVIRLALLTACRRAELTRARWKDIDLESDAPTWRIPPENSKTGSECINALVPEAVEEFRRLKVLAGRSPWVFPADAGDGPSDPKLLTRSIARHLPSLKERRIGAFTLHDLRRTTRTGLARLRVQPHIAEAVLNHRAPGVVAVYDRHSYLDEKREALGRWAAHLAKIGAAVR